MKQVIARWQMLSEKLAALSRREQALVALAAVALVYYIGNAIWVVPINARTATFARQASQQEKELAALQEQLQILQAQVANDPNVPLRQQISEVKHRLENTEERLTGYKKSLVPADKTVDLLDSILKQSKGVRLVGLKTLPVESLLAEQGAAAEKVTGESAAPLAISTGDINVYRHGFEMRLQGNYLDLLAYLMELEKQPQQVLWHRASLTVPEPAKAVLTLVFFTLSTDKVWIEL